MLTIIFWVLVGMFVGWAFPQPAFVKDLQDKAVEGVKSLFDKK